MLDLGGGKKAPRAKAKADDGAAGGEEELEDQPIPTGIARGMQPAVAGAKAIEKRTEPPKRLTEAALLGGCILDAPQIETIDLDALSDLDTTILGYDEDGLPR